MNRVAIAIAQRNDSETKRYFRDVGLLDKYAQCFDKQLHISSQLDQPQVQRAEHILHWLSSEDGDWHLSPEVYAVLVAAMLGKNSGHGYYAAAVDRIAADVVLDENGGLSYCDSRILSDGIQSLHR